MQIATTEDYSLDANSVTDDPKQDDVATGYRDSSSLRMTSLMEAYSPASTALRTSATISGRNYSYRRIYQLFGCWGVQGLAVQGGLGFGDGAVVESDFGGKALDEDALDGFGAGLQQNALGDAG
jgi:hypothetical protein